MNEKLIVVEKAQDNIDIQMIKETIDSLEDKYSKTQVNNYILYMRHYNPRLLDFEGQTCLFKILTLTL